MVVNNIEYIKGETLKLEKLEVATGAKGHFGEALMVKAKMLRLATQEVKGEDEPTGEVVSHGKGDKVTIVKFRRRKHSRFYSRSQAMVY